VCKPACRPIVYVSVVQNPEHVKTKMDLGRVKERIAIVNKELQREQKKEADKQKEIGKLKKDLEVLEAGKIA